MDDSAYFKEKAPGEGNALEELVGLRKDLRKLSGCLIAYMWLTIVGGLVAAFLGLR